LVANLGRDTDTVGAVYGQIAGAYYGANSIPDIWTSKIVHMDWITSFVNALLELSNTVQKD